MEFIHLLVIAGILILAGQAEANRRAIMAGVAEVAAAVDAARAEIEADKAAIIAEIQRLGLPDVDTSELVAKVAGLGQILDDVPGVTPVPPVEPPIEEVPPVEELPAEGE